MAEKNSFVMYGDYKQHLDLLTYEQKGKLLDALMVYANSGDVPEEDGMVMMAFSFIKAQIDRDNEKFHETCKKRSQAGKKGAEEKKAKQANADFAKEEQAKQANADFAEQTEAKQAENENENEKENDVTPNGVTKKHIGVSRSHNPKKVDPFEEYSAGDDELLAALRGYEQMRKQIKKPLTDQAKALALRKLDSLAMDRYTKIEIVNQSILNSWQGLFPVKKPAEIPKPSNRAF